MLNKDAHGFHTQNWAQAVSELNRADTEHVLVTLLGVAGSTPRSAGTKMVVTGTDIFDTLGGGHLEFKIIARAREMLAQSLAQQRIEHFPLGASLGQCCGGSVSVLFEPMLSTALPVTVFGAGHVAQALITILAGLPVRVRWIDSRAELFPEVLPANVVTVVDDEPAQQIRANVDGSVNLILTHNHQLDFTLTEQLLKQNRACFIGVIGSQTKAKRFRMRLAHKQFSDDQIAQITCPIGLDGIHGKLPMEVAVAIAAQIMQLYQQQQPSTSLRQGIQWQQLKNQLTVETTDS